MLNINTVVSVLLGVKEHGDWQRAFDCTLDEEFQSGRVGAEGNRSRKEKKGIR